MASYTVSLLQPKVIADMKLADHGYRAIERPISNFLPQDDGGYLKLGGGLERTQAEFRKFSEHDARILPAYYESLESVADVLRDLAMKSPPNLGDGIKTLIDGALQGRVLAKLPLTKQGPTTVEQAARVVRVQADTLPLVTAQRARATPRRG